MQHIPHLWPLGFCFGRVLCGPALAWWRGQPVRWKAGQRALARQVATAVAAVGGQYTQDAGLELATV